MTQTVAHFGKTPKKPKLDVDSVIANAKALVGAPKPDVKTTNTLKLARLDFEGVDRRTLPLWDDRWPKEALIEQRADMSARDFDRGFRQIAISDEDLYFPREAVLACTDDTHTAIDRMSEESRFKKMPIYVGVDLAIADAVKAGSFFVISVVAIDRSHHRWLLWMERGRGITFDDQILAIEDVYERFKPDVIEVENNGYQEAVCQNSRKKNLPVESYTTTSISKRDLEIGLPGMGVEWEQHRWHIPDADARSKRVFKPLLDELAVYPLAGYHDDCVMATFFAREGMRTAPKIQPKIVSISMGRSH